MPIRSSSRNVCLFIYVWIYLYVPFPCDCPRGAKEVGVLGQIHQGRVLGKVRHGAKVYLSGEVSRWRVCHQRGLPRLVL